MNGAQRQPIDLLVVGASEVLTCDGDGDDPIGRVTGGAVAVAGDSVVAVGPESEVRASVDSTGARVVDALGGVVAPGFVDALSLARVQTAIMRSWDSGSWQAVTKTVLEG